MFNIKTNSYVLLSCICLLALSACSDDDFTVNTKFTNTNDIEVGRQVYLNDVVIGEVTAVEPVDNGISVAIGLDKKLVSSIGSRSAVVVNRLKQGAPLEIYNRPASDNSVLESGQTIKGLDSMFQLGAWMVGDAIQLGSGTVSQYVESFQDYLQGEQFQQDKQTVQSQIESAANVAQDVLKNVEQEVNRVAEDLSASEGAAAQAVEQLGDELVPVVQELASSGAQLIAQLEELTKKLQQTDPEQQQAGEQFMASLLATLEKLNQSIEEGAEGVDGSDESKVESGIEKP